MFKKSFLAIMLVAIGIFAVFGTAKADQIDGLVNGAGTPVLPTGLNLYVNPGGSGDALIYGYYNVRGAWDFIRVVNTSSTRGVGAKVRFREGRNSNEVIDFGICLSSHDQWTAWVIGDTNPNNAATLYVYDTDTPMYPDFGTSVVLKDKDTGAAPSVTADDTKEGYLEIIGSVSWDESKYKHVDTAAKCETALTTDYRVLDDVPNTLFGVAYIFDVTSPMYGTYAYNATALADFSHQPIVFSLASDSSPRLDNGTDIDGDGNSLNEVNYVLAKWREYATYDIEDWWKGATTIINTFPTKRWSINLLPFNGPFNDSARLCADGTIGTYDANTTDHCSTTDTSARCEAVTVELYDDKENSPHQTSGVSPGETTHLTKCDEVSLITVGTNASPVLATNLNQFNIVTPAGYVMGWLAEDFLSVNGVVDSTRSTTFTHANTHQTAFGLPVISYELQNVVGAWSHMLPLRYDSGIINW